MIISAQNLKSAMRSGVPTRTLQNGNKRIMALRRFSGFKKTSGFTEKLDPDGAIPNVETALKNEKDIIHTPRILKSGAFSWSLPEERSEYQYLTSSPTGLRDLGLDEKYVESEEYRKITSGQMYLENHDFQKNGYPFPYAQAYAGWQFGQFAGQLGDGRVLNLFEIPKARSVGESIPRYEIQLKGIGKTPYSRFADGKAVLRSSIREYIISEHLNAIGIPSTRALSLTFLPKTFARRHRYEKCAIVTRFAELWVRLGTFDLYRWRSDRQGVRKLADYVVSELFTVGDQKFEHFNSFLPEISNFFKDNKTVGDLTRYDKMYLEIVLRNAKTAAMWQCYGFLNGVLNTDNTSVLGLSIDFGPFSIMDKFDPNYTPNSEDLEGRYNYQNTPTAIWWNLVRFGEDLAELIGAGSEIVDDPLFKNEGIKKEWEEKIITRATKLIEIGGEIYMHAFTKTFVETMLGRLGLSPGLIVNGNYEEVRLDLIQPMQDMLRKARCDYNKFFVMLQSFNFESDAEFNPLELSQAILTSVNSEDAEIVTNNNEVTESVEKWLSLYRSYVLKSELLDGTKRVSTSRRNNPLFLPRNWILDKVIDFTEESDGNDLSYLHKLEKMSMYPFDEQKWGDELKDLEKEWLVQGDKGSDYSMLQCSCAS